MTIRIRGYFGGDQARAEEGTVDVVVSGTGINEMLSIAFHGRYRVTVPVRALRQLAQNTRRQGAEQTGAVELADKVAGYYSDARVNLHRASISLWFRRKDGFEMLSLEYADRGQISIPFQPVETLLRRWRRNYV